MDKPKETIRFLDNFDIALSLDNRSDSGRVVTNIDVNIQPLVLRLSLRDILLVKSIVNRAIEMSNRAPPTPAPSRPSLTTSLSKRTARAVSASRVPKARRRSSAAALNVKVIMSKESVSSAPSTPLTDACIDLREMIQLTATVDGFQLILIGDTHDLPMIDVKAGKFSATVNDWSSDVSRRLCRPQHLCTN